MRYGEPWTARLRDDGHSTTRVHGKFRRSNDGKYRKFYFILKQLLRRIRRCTAVADGDGDLRDGKTITGISWKWKVENSDENRRNVVPRTCMRKKKIKKEKRTFYLKSNKKTRAGARDARSSRAGRRTERATGRPADSDAAMRLPPTRTGCRSLGGGSVAAGTTQIYDTTGGRSGGGGHAVIGERTHILIYNI